MNTRVTGNPNTTSVTQGGAGIVGGRDRPHDGPGPKLMSTDTLQGDSVVNAKGEGLGNIEEIMIDVQRGRIAYAVLSCGGFLGATASRRRT